MKATEPRFQIRPTFHLQYDDEGPPSDYDEAGVLTTSRDNFQDLRIMVQSKAPALPGHQVTPPLLPPPSGASYSCTPPGTALRTP